MNKVMALSMLVLAACAGPSAAMRASSASFAGPWHGVLAKGETRNAADFRFSGSDGAYQGYVWGRELTPVELSNVQLGGSVHFEIPQMGVFDGTSNGHEMEGTFRDGSGEGRFKLVKELDPTDPNAMFF